MSEFKTSDLYLAAYILCKGYKPTKKPFLEDDLVIYLFPQSKELEAVVKDFYDYNAQVDACTLLEYFRRVRTSQWSLRKKAGVE